MGTAFIGLPYLGSGRWLPALEIPLAQDPFFIQETVG